MKKPKKKSDKPIPSKELQKAIDLFPKILKRNEKAAKEKARIRKNFEKARKEIFGQSK